MKVAIVTDSNSGITQAEAKALGIFVVPMPFMIGEETYFEDVNLSQSEFYEKLSLGLDISTSQPSVGGIVELWTDILKEYDEIVHIPMSSGLSASCETATNFAKDFGGKVQVVNNQRISVLQKSTVFEAMELAKQKKSAIEIKEYLEDTKYLGSIYIMVDTLKYLKKGGRVTAAGAAIGTLLNIKPVLQINGGKLDAYQKVMSVKQAKNVMIRALQKDLNGRFKEYADANKMYIAVAHTNNEKEANIFADEIRKAIPNVRLMYVDPLSLSVSCHTGPGVLACGTYIKNY